MTHNIKIEKLNIEHNGVHIHCTGVILSTAALLELMNSIQNDETAVTQSSITKKDFATIGLPSIVQPVAEEIATPTVKEDFPTIGVPSFKPMPNKEAVTENEKRTLMYLLNLNDYLQNTGNEPCEHIGGNRWRVHLYPTIIFKVIPNDDLFLRHSVLKTNDKFINSHNKNEVYMSIHSEREETLYKKLTDESLKANPFT